MKYMTGILIILVSLSISTVAHKGERDKPEKDKDKVHSEDIKKTPRHDYKKKHKAILNELSTLSNDELHSVIKKNIVHSKKTLMYIHMANEVLEKRTRDSYK